MNLGCGVTVAAQLPNVRREFPGKPSAENRTLGLTRGDQIATQGMRILSHGGETLKLM
jgi:hypothetical protein